MTPDELENRLIDFGVMVYGLVEKLPRTRLGIHIADQATRSSSSPSANYAEARSAESRRDFIHKLRICLKELRETRVWLVRIPKHGLLPTFDPAPAIREANELISIFVTSVNTATRNAPK